MVNRDDDYAPVPYDGACARIVRLFVPAPAASLVMVSVNPHVVRTPDGRMGCLVARLGLQGCVSFGTHRILETFPLVALIFIDLIAHAST